MVIDRFDLCIIGAGSGGLSVAAGAAQMGARVCLIERDAMGGDCLNVGCVPSKALIAAAAASRMHRTGADMGVDGAPPRVDWPRVQAHLRDVIAAIEPNDSEDRFRGLGVDVIRAPARFVARDRVEAGGRSLTARRFVIASGSRPTVPPVPGLADGPYLTNESVFDLPDFPQRLLVLGGGAIGCELAQAFARLGAQVTIVEAADRLLANEPGELAHVVIAALAAEGVDIRTGAAPARVEWRADGGVHMHVGDAVLEGTHLLVATGRVAALDLGLDAAGIATAKGGIVVDRRLRTSNRRVFAIGDCRQGPKFTHAAGYDAGIVIRNALFQLPARADYSALPRVTFTDPELAMVGMTEAEARARHGDRVSVLRWPFHDNDRAQAERATAGLVLLVAVGGRAVGAGIVGRHAGELIHLWSVAIAARLKLSAIAGAVAPYPILSEVSKRAAGSAFTPALFSPRTRAVVRLLQKLP